MNRIDRLFADGRNNILSVYFTAGFPQIDSTVETIELLSRYGADMIEIGMPFSDPMADGPVIQKSSQTALNNGMNLKLLFSQLEGIRKKTDIPLIMMGYLNPILKFGVEAFCRSCSEVGIDGLILPDLPPEVYESEYSEIFEKYGIYNILLISPGSSDERIRKIDSLSKGFIYIVSTSAVTGTRGNFSSSQTGYFDRVRSMNLHNPCLIGFGISGRDSFNTACSYARGGIIGSAFIKAVSEHGELGDKIGRFMAEVRYSRPDSRVRSKRMQ